jgi:diguanylate cyclase (GGDEF)-like protein
MRPADTAARLGGDEFAVLLEDVENAGEAVGVARRIQGALRAPVPLGSNEVSVEVSIGVALDDRARSRPGEILRKADLALYLAKRDGKGGYAVARSGSDGRVGVETFG